MYVVSVDTAQASVLSKLEFLFIERKAKNDSVGFS